MIERTEVIDFIVQSIWNSNHKNLDIDTHSRDLIKEKWSQLNTIQMLDLWEEIRARVIYRIQKYIEEYYKRDLTPRYYFIDFSDSKLSRYDNLIRDPEEKRITFLVITQREAVLSVLECMKWRSFEFFSGFLLSLYSFEDYIINKGSKERGIDFIGLTSLSRFLPVDYLRFKKYSDIIVVGQAKHWKNKIQVKDIDVFIKRFRDFKDGNHIILPKLPERYKDKKAENRGFFVTLSSFTKGAIESAEEDNIIIKDGEQISEDTIRLLLARDEQKWFIAKEKEEISLNEENFKKLIKSLCEIPKEKILK